MNIEENRLRTFSSWPANAPIDPERLARAGFYATDNLLETECHWCRKRISDWEYGDQIMARHRRLFPLCMFVINPTECGNVPRYIGAGNESVIGSSNMALIDLKIESNRLATFKNWPNPNISPQSLSKAGFYYFNNLDQAKCAWCGGIIAKWEKNDNAFEEHQRFFPECPRVQLGPLIEIASDGIRELGIQQISAPKKSKYSSLDARMRTYANWPITDIQKPDALAQAGFYYQEIDDQVRCFHCNGGLRSWQKEDDPWFDHAKWFPDCHFVKLAKGPQYVTRVQEMARRCVVESMPPPERPTTLDEAMNTPPVLEALKDGVDVGYIRSSTQKQLERCGRPFDTSQELINSIISDLLVEDLEQNMTQQLSRVLNVFVGEDNTAMRAGEQPALSFNHGEYNNIPPSTSSANNIAELPAPSSQQPIVPAPTSICTPTSIPGPSKWVPKPTLKDDMLESNEEKNISLEEENRKLKDARQCKVCMDEEVAVVFLPCGHLVTCVQCAPGVSQCPLCRTEIKGFVRTFLS